MNLRSARVRAALALLALALLAGCGDHPTGPVGGAGAGTMATIPVRAAVQSPAVSTLAVTVTAPDITDPLVFDLELQDGLAEGTLRVPAGSDRTFTVRAFDADGTETHEGSATTDVKPGQNPPLVVTLAPLAGGQPIQVILGELTLDVAPQTASVGSGDTARLVATVTGASGDTVDVAVVWATDAPAVATVDSSGLVTGVMPGQARIQASAAGVTAGADVTVTEGSPSVLDANTYGRLADGGTDTYTFDATAGDLVNAAVQSDSFAANLGVAILAPDGSTVASGYFQRLVPTTYAYVETGITELPTTGTYTVRVSSPGGASGPYVLGVPLIEPPTSVTVDPPYADLTAPDIAIMGDRRFFAFQGTAGEILKIAAHTPDSLTAYLRLRGPGTEPFYSRSEVAAVRTTDYNYGAEHQESGRLVLGQAGEYVLEVDPRSTEPQAEYFGGFTADVIDPSDDPATLDAEEDATTDPVFDFDRWTFDVPSGEAGVLVFLASNDYTDPYGPAVSSTTDVTVYDGTGVAVGGGVVDPASGGATGHPARAGTMLIAPGSYVAEMDPRGLGQGPYAVRVVGIEPPVTLTAASPTADGTIGVPGEEDYYEFQGVSGDTITVTASVDAGGSFTGAVAVYEIDPVNGDFVTPLLLPYPSPFGPDMYNGALSATRTVAPTADGTFVIRIRDPYYFNGVVHTGPYHIAVSGLSR